jgi:hypothetical protein
MFLVYVVAFRHLPLILVAAVLIVPVSPYFPLHQLSGADETARHATIRPATGSVNSRHARRTPIRSERLSKHVYFRAVNQRTRSQVSVLICLPFGELVRTTIVSLSTDTWNWRMRFLPTSAEANASSRWCVTVRLVSSMMYVPKYASYPLSN